MKKTIFISAFLAALLNVAPQQALAEDSLWEKTKAGASSAWKSTTELVDDAVVWTVERSSAAWEATREAANDAADWTGEKAEKGWQATREATTKDKNKG